MTRTGFIALLAGIVAGLCFSCCDPIDAPPDYGQDDSTGLPNPGDGGRPQSM